MKRIVLVLAAAAALFSMSCSKEEKKDEQLTLRFSWWGGEERHQATLAAIEVYQAKNPHVTIEAEYGGWDGYYQKLVTQLAGGTAADIIQIDQPWLHELSSRGDVFVTLDDAADLSEYDAKFLENYCSFDGKVKGVPTGLNGETFLVDKALLEKAGINPAEQWDWESIVSEGAKLNRYDASSYFLALVPDQFRFFLEKYISQLAGGLINADKSLAFTEAQAVEAFTYLQQWIDNKVCAPFSETSIFNKKFYENPAWLNGKMAVGLIWASNLDQVREARQNMYVASLPVLPNAKDTGVIVRPSQLIVINENSKAREEAIKFLDFLFSDTDSINALATTRGIPPTDKARAVLKEQGLIDAHAEGAVNNALAQMGKPQSVWQMNSEIQQIMDDIVERFGYGIIDAKQAAKELITQLTEKLATL